MKVKGKHRRGRLKRRWEQHTGKDVNAEGIKQWSRLRKRALGRQNKWLGLLVR
jgi:hypothetical protein